MSTGRPHCKCRTWMLVRLALDMGYCLNIRRHHTGVVGGGWGQGSSGGQEQGMAMSSSNPIGEDV